MRVGKIIITKKSLTQENRKKKKQQEGVERTITENNE